jgi:hypothetical protein
LIRRSARDCITRIANIGAKERSITSELAFGAQEHDFNLVAFALDPLECCLATHGSTAPVALMYSVAATGTCPARVVRRSREREIGLDEHARAANVLPPSGAATPKTRLLALWSN